MFDGYVGLGWVWVATGPQIAQCNVTEHEEGFKAATLAYAASWEKSPRPSICGLIPKSRPLGADSLH